MTSTPTTSTAAFAELDARYLAGEAAAYSAHLVGRQEMPAPRSIGASHLRRHRTGRPLTIGERLAVCAR